MRHSILAGMLVACLLLAGAGPARAGEAPATLTEADAGAWLDGLMPLAVAAGDISGAAIAVVKDGRVLLAKGYGYADFATGKPVDPATTLFRAGSVSKLFTWTAVMQQVERGRLDLDADVQTYLDFVLPVRDDGPVTLRHLLTHTAGFDETGRGMYSVDPAKMAPMDQWVRNPPARVRRAGATSAYSNYGTTLAGYIVQRVSGMKFAAYVDAEILVPLNMRHSSFEQPLPASLLPGMATGYRSVRDPYPFELISAAPAGALSATATDMANFMIAFLQQGRFGDARILKPETVSLMLAPAVTPAPGLPPMALGWYHRQRGGQLTLAHAGDIQGFHAEMNILPGSNTGFYVAINGSPLGSAILRRQLWNGFLDRYYPAADPQLPTLQTAAEHGAMVAGRYAVTRNPQASFLAMGSILGQTRLSVDADGTLVTTMTNLSRLPKRWREVAPFEWREENGTSRLIAVVENGKVVQIATDDAPPVVELRPVAFSGSGGWIQPALIGSLLVAAAGVLGALARGARRLRVRGESAPRDRGRVVATVVAALLLVFQLGWLRIVQAIGDFSKMNDGLDSWIRVLQLVLLLATAGMLALLYTLVQGRGVPRGRIVFRACLLLAGAMTIWFAWNYNLLQARIAF